MRHDPSDLGSLIQIRIIPKERTLSLKDMFFLRSVVTLTLLRVGCVGYVTVFWAVAVTTCCVVFVSGTTVFRVVSRGIGDVDNFTGSVIGFVVFLVLNFSICQSKYV